MKTLKIILGTIVTIFVVLGLVFIYQFFVSNNQKDNKINVTIDKTVIVQKVQNLNRLETVNMVIQRDITVELNLGDIKFLGLPSFESKRVQTIAVTGSVTAGIDLSKIDTNKVKLDEVNSKLDLELPAPEILNISFNEDKTTLLKDKLTLLYQLQTLDGNKRDSLTQELQKQVIKQSREALRDGACNDKILDKASANGKVAVTNLFAFSNLKTINVTVGTTEKCDFNGI